MERSKTLCRSLAVSQNREAKAKRELKSILIYCIYRHLILKRSVTWKSTDEAHL